MLVVSHPMRGVGLACVVLAMTGIAPVAQAVPTAFAGWTKVFEDTFEDTNWTDKWQTYRTPGTTAGGGSGIYKTDAVTEANNNLRVEAYSVGNTDYVGSVRSKQSWTFGYFEANIKMEGASGMHTAFWMMPASTNINTQPPNARINGGEIDIVEHRKYDGNNIDISDDYWTATHYGGYGQYHVGPGKLNLNKTSDGAFHKYGVQWNKDMYKFFIDDVYVGYTINDTNAQTGQTNVQISEVPEYMIFSANVGVPWAGTVGNYGARGSSGSRMIVADVAVYQNLPAASLSTVVPEPATLGLIGIVAMMLRRRR